MLGGGILLVLIVGLFVLMSLPKGDDARMARRLVKTATDPMASQINLTPQDTTIKDLVANKAPSTLGERVGPFEMTTWRLSGTVETIEKKKDGDFYMVLRGDDGEMTVVEVPDPDTMKGAPMEGDVRKTREALENEFHPTSDKQDVNKKATITGVGFYGWGNSGSKKGSSGYSGSRLMPGMGVEFGDDSK